MSLIQSAKKLLNNPSIDSLYRLISYGKVVNPTSLFELRENQFKGYQKPVFFLSTGRCGTSWFTTLLSTNKQLKVFHVPQPELAAQSRLAYELLITSDSISAREEKLLTEVFLAGREELLLNCIKSGVRFIETDPRPTFFAPIIAKIWPDAVFIHLYRHPAEVVRSGIRRHWYNTTASHELSRIQPVSTDGNYMKWQHFDQLEKISWLWAETNAFVEDFKESIGKGRYFNFNFNELSADTVNELLGFLNIEIKSATINKLLNVRVNKQEPDHFPEYNDWDEPMKEKLINICGPLMQKYNYTL